MPTDPESCTESGNIIMLHNYLKLHNDIYFIKYLFPLSYKYL